ncbi:branched-chain amino acid ABC transporter permease [Nocardiopsis changdeensis]|uniref:Branched-chain amino acid ABC transporter permease n=1 Tax=Nocardiopsis changdeensis TaxID=2831969 RepID=A0ABX8BK40_9ACTN|nr:MULTISPECIES: branched-chain amino acid ABC transporter permease [Nocardiopsis]QUX22590.1 branched-chain amino acid ABC transporter permease [Nocardiopsis changdeensis]QYX38531.1 branched-chain amino acid ABC transporter permease [Nocardiopsis sp. MT53]
MSTSATEREPRSAESAPDRGSAPRRGWADLPSPLRHLLLAALALAAVTGLLLVTGDLTALRMAAVGYTMLAVAGLQLLTGGSGQVSLGHGAFMMIGAYTMALLVLNLPMLPLAANLVLVVAVAVVAGIAVGAATARLHGPYLAGATLILAVGLPGLTHRYHEVFGGSNGLTVRTAGAPPFLQGLVTDSEWKALVVWTAVVLGLAVLATISTGRLGRRMRTVRDDETAAAMSGVPVGGTKVTAFVIASAAGGLAGGLQVYVLGTATPSMFTLSLSLTLLAALVLGGIGSMWGALWAALAVVYLEIWLSDAVRAFELSKDVENNLPIVLFGVLLILVLRFQPLGLHGILQRLRALLRRSR